MKISQYNVITHRNNNSYWYNTLSKKFFRLPSPISEKVEDMIAADDLAALPALVHNKLLEGGFIIEDDTNEIEEIRRRHRERVEHKDYFLIILPTLNCNYHCWYCIQNHVESRMSEDTKARLKAHIDHMVDKEHITSLAIDWFGGEPFLYFDDVVVPLSEYAKKKCEDAGIQFSNSSTSNGYFLSKEVAEKCVELGFRHFQITLDGDKESHDKVKFQKGCESTFNHVLGNIDALLDLSNDMLLYLRINYTHKNISEEIVEQVNRHIKPDNRRKILITPRKVWQEGVDRSFSARLLNILDKFKVSGYNVQYWNPIMDYVPCYANRKYYNAINFNGHVVKCTACDDLYDEEPKGELLEDGVIRWHNGFDELYLSPTFENERCISCNKLPICMGLCPRNHINGGQWCQEESMESTFEDSIIDYIDRTYAN